LDADESEETEALILTAIEERVAQRNKINADKMRKGGAILASEVFARNAIVSLLIPKEMRLIGEMRRIFCRVIQHTRGGYQLNTKWGLLSNRFPHSELNGVDDDLREIPQLTVQEAKNAKKIRLGEVIGKMNSRGSVRASQRAGQKRRQGRRRVDQVAAADDSISEVIEVEAPPARRQRTIIEIDNEGGSSPSIGAAVRSRAVMRGRALRSRRGRQ
jgi:hypothetical protein